MDERVDEEPAPTEQVDAYIRDMLQQLARMAETNGRDQLADRIKAAAAAAGQPSA